MKKGLFVLFGLCFIIFLSSGIFALNNDIICSIVPKAQCQIASGGSSYILMHLSYQTNAHGELASQTNYNSDSSYVVCCNFAASTQCSADNDDNGVPDNKILGLSSDTNAHAEILSGTAYTTSNVCFSDLSCIGTTSACGLDHPIGIVSLSATTNAQIGPIGTYISNGGVNICCTSLTYIVSAFWSKNGFTKASRIDVVPDKTIIQAILKNSQLPENRNLKIEIYEDDIILDDLIKKITTKTDVNGKFVENWVITQADLDKGKSLEDLYEAYNNMQFYFKVFNADDNKLITTSDNLKVNVLASTFCNDKFVCGDYAQNLCTNNDPCNVAANSIPVGISCTGNTANCFCSWDTATSICQGVSELLSYDIKTGVESVLGKCVINANGKSGTCAQGGTISYGWTAVWTGDSKNKPASCIDGHTDLQCPAQIQLPFFGFYNFLITGLLIALIYAMLLRNKK